MGQRFVFISACERACIWFHVWEGVCKRSGLELELGRGLQMAHVSLYQGEGCVHASQKKKMAEKYIDDRL